LYESLASTKDGTILDRKSEISVAAAERESSRADQEGYLFIPRGPVLAPGPPRFKIENWKN
jgi:hypothetical protein